MAWGSLFDEGGEGQGTGERIVLCGEEYVSFVPWLAYAGSQELVSISEPDLGKGLSEEGWRVAAGAESEPKGFLHFKVVLERGRITYIALQLGHDESLLGVEGVVGGERNVEVRVERFLVDLGVKDSFLLVAGSFEEHEVQKGGGGEGILEFKLNVSFHYLHRRFDSFGCVGIGDYEDVVQVSLVIKDRVLKATQYVTFKDEHEHVGKDGC